MFITPCKKKKLSIFFLLLNFLLTNVYLKKTVLLKSIMFTAHVLVVTAKEVTEPIKMRSALFLVFRVQVNQSKIAQKIHTVFSSLSAAQILRRCLPHLKK